MPEEWPYATPKPEREPFGWPFWLLFTILIVILAGLTKPNVTICRKNANQTEATNNLRQIGLVLHDFVNDYGYYPSDATAAAVKADYPTHGSNLGGRSSNALFRQLFAAELTQSESMF